jgi:Zn ribbon nucleic-acid-binding protein
MIDAEGRRDDVPCPVCGSGDTITYDYVEGFSELECASCGYRSDADEISALQRYSGDLLEANASHDAPPIPVRSLKA